MYTLETLKPLNMIFDSEHRLEQSDVELVNDRIERIKSTRSENPCPGDIVEYTDEYGDYCKNAHIRAVDDETGRLLVHINPYTPFIHRNDDGASVGFHHTGGGPSTYIDPASLTYIGKREKMFAVFSSHCILPGHSAVYFKAMVNTWEYIAPDQKYPGYSTKDWVKHYISYIEKPNDGSGYHYFRQNIVFKTALEFRLWKATYKAVEFPGSSENQVILFLYRENDKLITREEWDALDLPLDTRQINGVNSTHVKVAYDDDAHMITVHRFTNSGYLDYRKFGPYEKAKGTALVAPGPEIKGVKSWT